jgi:aminopeptidase N
VPAAYVEAFRSILKDPVLDKAMVCKMLILPAESYLIQLSEEADVEVIHRAREFVRIELATQLSSELLQVYRENRKDEDSRALHFAAMSQRALKNAVLSLAGAMMHATDSRVHRALKDEYMQLVDQQFHSAGNMTDAFAALSALVNSGEQQRAEAALQAFHEKWHEDAQVMEQWFSVQASSPVYADLARINALMVLPDFDLTNPNKVRSVVGAFCNQNLLRFHDLDGSGYRFLADIILQLDKLNPQIAARLMTPLTRWRKYDQFRQSKLKQQLERIRQTEKLSKDVREVVEKSLL